MTTLAQRNDTLLHKALRGNVLFSAISGLILIIDAGAIANFMGVSRSLPFIVIGILLLAHAANLYFNTLSRPTRLTIGWFAVIGDVAWVIASAYILLADPFNLTSSGKWVVLIVADLVLVFAVVQYVGIRRMK